MNTSTAIKSVKQNLKLNEWSAQIEAQQTSGLTVQKWCEEKGLSTKTYYYRLRKVREQCLDFAPTIVPVSVPHSNESVRIEKNGLQISLPGDISAETLIALVKELC